MNYQRIMPWRVSGASCLTPAEEHASVVGLVPEGQGRSRIDGDDSWGGEALMAEAILILDDEKNVLQALERTFRGCGFNILSASNAEMALQIIASRDIAVILSDQRLPDKTGVELLAAAREISPTTRRLLLTGHSDLETTVCAINQGGINGFFNKPWDNEELRTIVTKNVEAYRLAMNHHHIDEDFLLGLVALVELKDPYTKGHCERVSHWANLVGSRLGMSGIRLECLKYAGLLHDIGKIGVDEGILNFPGKLSESQFEKIKQHSEWGAQVLSQAKLPNVVVGAVRYHHEHYDGSGYPAGLKGKEIPWAARIMTVIDVFDALTSKRCYRDPMPLTEACRIMMAMRGTTLDPELTDFFFVKLADPDIPRGLLPVEIPTEGEWPMLA